MIIHTENVYHLELDDFEMKLFVDGLIALRESLAGVDGVEQTRTTIETLLLDAGSHRA